MILALLRAKYDGLTARRLAEESDNYRGTDGLGRVMRDRGVSDNAITADIEEIMTTLMDTVYTARHGKYNAEDGNLVDQIAAIVSAPWAGNYLSPTVLKQLRKAILTTDEMAGLNERLNRKEVHCAMCEHKFQNGEAIILSSDGAGTNLFVCARCASPTNIACQSCVSGHASIPGGMVGQLSKMTCGDHGAKKANEVGGDVVAAALGNNRVRVRPVDPARRNAVDAELQRQVANWQRVAAQQPADLAAARVPTQPVLNVNIDDIADNGGI